MRLFNSDNIKARLSGKGKFGVAGILAAGLAIGGIGFGTTASAASSVPYNSVSSPQIVNRSIQSYDMNSGLVNALLAVPTNGVSSSAKIAPGAIDITDLNGALQKKVNAVGTGQPGLSYGCDGKVVDATHPAATCPGKDGTNGTNGTNGTDGKDGAPGLSELEADGPYPGSTDLGSIPGQGDNSDEKVPAGGADAKPVQLWVQCAPGKVALGGGFRLGADQAPSVGGSIHVLASEPTQVEDGKLVNKPIAGDPADSIQPNGWLVEVVNTGSTEATVRPWVTCAKVAQ